MTPTEKDAMAPAVLDRIGTAPISETERGQVAEARAHLAARLAAQTKMLADCFRAAGADCDGNEDWRIADRAYQAVCDLREDYNEACEELHGENGWVKRATRAEAEAQGVRHYMDEEGGKLNELSGDSGQLPTPPADKEVGSDG